MLPWICRLTHAISYIFILNAGIYVSNKHSYMFQKWKLWCILIGYGVPYEFWTKTFGPYQLKSCIPDGFYDFSKLCLHFCFLITKIMWPITWWANPNFPNPNLYYPYGVTCPRLFFLLLFVRVFWMFFNVLEFFWIANCLKRVLIRTFVKTLTFGSFICCVFCSFCKVFLIFPCFRYKFAMFCR